MKCKICGSEIRPGDTVCHVCGVIIDYHDYVNDPYDTYGNQDNNNNYDNNYNNYNNNNPLPPTDNDNFTFFSNTNKSSNKKNSEKTKYLIAAIVAVVLLIGCGVLLVKVLSPEPKAVEGDDDIILGDGGDSGKNTESPELPTTPTEPTEPQDTYESFEGYKFKVANGYTVHQEQESLIFENKTEQFEFVLSIYHSNPYDIYVQRKDEVKQQWVDRGYVVNEYGEKLVENTSWLVLSSVYNGKPFSIVYRGFFNNSTLELLILNSGSLTNEQVYSKIELMLSSTEIDASPSGTNTNA